MELSYLDICFNVSSILQWLSNPGEIAPEGDTHSQGEVIRYEVTLVPTGKKRFYFFHKKINDFSTTLHAVDRNIKEPGIDELEFIWWAGCFELSANGMLVFTATDEDVIDFLERGKFSSRTALREGLTGSIISAGVNNDRCRKVKRISYRDQLTLSNSLASISVTRCGKLHRVQY